MKIFLFSSLIFLFSCMRHCWICGAVGPGSGTRLDVGFLSIFFLGNIILLELLISFSLAPKGNPVLFRKDFV